jgi:predicted HTH transcriptional regulator
VAAVLLFGANPQRFQQRVGRGRPFSDRLDVWNSGTLPGTLTLEDLRTDHASIPHNPLLAESLYFAGYIEKLGSDAGGPGGL